METQLNWPKLAKLTASVVLLLVHVAVTVVVNGVAWQGYSFYAVLMERQSEGENRGYDEKSEDKLLENKRLVVMITFV